MEKADISVESSLARISAEIDTVIARLVTVPDKTVATCWMLTAVCAVVRVVGIAVVTRLFPSPDHAIPTGPCGPHTIFVTIFSLIVVAPPAVVVALLVALPNDFIATFGVATTVCAVVGIVSIAVIALF